MYFGASREKDRYYPAEHSLRAGALAACILLISVPFSGQAAKKPPDFRQDFAAGTINWSGEWAVGGAGHESFFRIDRLRPGWLVRDHRSYSSNSSRDYFMDEMRQIVRPYRENGFWDPAARAWVRRLLWSPEEGWYGADLRHDWRFSVELQEGALEAAIELDIDAMDTCLAGELEYIHGYITPGGSIASLPFDGNEYEYGLVLSALALGAVHFDGNDQPVANASYADLKRLFGSMNKSYAPPSRPDEGMCVLMRGFANAYRAFDLLSDAVLKQAARAHLADCAADAIAHQVEDGSFDLLNNMCPVQDQLKADIALMMAYRVSRDPRYVEAVRRNLRWIVDHRWDSSEKRMGGLCWSGVDSTSYYECHQMWFSIATKYLDDYSFRDDYTALRAEALGFVLDDNFAGVDMFVDNEKRYGPFFAYRAVSRDGTIQKEPFHRWKGAYEIGASLWALALNYNERTDGHSWLMTQVPEDSSGSWDDAIFTVRDFGPDCMVFRWCAEFANAGREGAYTGIFSDRRGDWRILLDTTHGFAYRDVQGRARVLVDKSLLESDEVYSVTMERTGEESARLILEGGGRLLCDAVVTDLKPWRSCCFGVFQDNGGDRSAENIRINGITQKPGEKIPAVTQLNRCFPNPFNSETCIEYHIGAKGLVCMRVFDLSGRLVANLERATRDIGPYRAHWNGFDQSGRRAASGVYFCVLETSGISQSTKLVLVR
jgi:hypothetical protein